MRVLLVRPAIREDAARDVSDVLDQARAVTLALQASGHEVTECAVTLDLGALDAELGRGYDVVFNLVEELGGSGRLAPLVPALVRGRSLPCTGAGPAEMSLCDDKLGAKLAWVRSALPTPSFRLADGTWVPKRPTGPLILKGRFEHASVGLEAENVKRLDSETELAEAIATARTRVGGDVLIEEYIHGREFNVALLPASGRLTTLAPAEILFEAVPEGAPRVVGYKAKWDEASEEYLHTPRHHDFGAEDQPLLSELRQLALRACRVLGVKSYARVDFRVDDQGKPFILEVNTNPCLSPDAGFAAALARAGQSFESAVEELLVAAKLEADETRTGHSGVSASANPGRVRSFGTPSDGNNVSSLVFRTAPRSEDVQAVARLVEGTGHFTKEEVDIAAELVEERLRDGEASGYHFVFLDDGPELLGYSCWGPTPGTDNSFDLYWIAVSAQRQGAGLGRRVGEETERCVARYCPKGARLYAETSGTPLYSSTRAFYERCGYQLVARLEDFYRAGDDKVVYLKVVS